MSAHVTSAAAKARGTGSRHSFGSGAKGIWEVIEGFGCSFWGRNHTRERWGKLLTFRKKTCSWNKKKKKSQPDELPGAEEKACFVEGYSCEI